MGFAAAKEQGYEADDFLAAAAKTWPGDVLVATSDRDAFQLVSERVTILQPSKGVSEITRIGPAEVRERYNVEPEQVPDLIALRGDRRTSSRARAGSARRRRPICCASTARSRRCSPTGGSRPRRRIYGSSGESRRWTPLLLFLPSKPRHRHGRRRPPSPRAFA
jgi:5''-3'' exonuclease (including N-terminal domain of PolI)